jgi:hypothetical protein
MRAHTGTHEHTWRLIHHRRLSSGDYLVTYRCTCGVERHSTEDDRPTDDENTPT